MKIDLHVAAGRVPTVEDSKLGFGKVFSPHMFVMDHDVQNGWHDARVVPYGPLLLDPAAAVFHYGQALFEGLKAFRGKDGGVNLFRLSAHSARMQEGAARICSVAPDVAAFEEGVRTLVDVDRAFVPRTRGTALYIRPTLIATEGFLGVRPSQKTTFFVITSPVGAYYAEGLNPVKIWVEDRYVRAAPGGLGAVKAGANYAASLLAAEEAKKRGYSQVLWLDAANHSALEEVGTMNLFVVFKDEVATPALGGSILAGVTRDSAITLLRSWGHKVSERTITMDEISAGYRDGTLLEVFGTGTAAVVSPVGELGWKDQKYVLGAGKVGTVAQRLYDAITSIQYGEQPDTHGWLSSVPVGRAQNGASVARNGAAVHA